MCCKHKNNPSVVCWKWNITSITWNRSDFTKRPPPGYRCASQTSGYFCKAEVFMIGEMLQINLALTRLCVYGLIWPSELILSFIRFSRKSLSLLPAALYWISAPFDIFLFCLSLSVVFFTTAGSCFVKKRQMELTDAVRQSNEQAKHEKDSKTAFSYCFVSITFDE